MCRYGASCGRLPDIHFPAHFHLQRRDRVSAILRHTYDQALNKFDARLFGTTVSALAHRASEFLPARCFDIADMIYFGMFGQLGATVVICGLCSGAKRAFQFVGAILLVQLLALTLFYVWPSHGPYYTCVGHFERLRFNLFSYGVQKDSLEFAQHLWEHQPIQILDLRYYLAFPCTHLSQPLIVLWFLRHSRRVVVALVGL